MRGVNTRPKAQIRNDGRISSSMQNAKCKILYLVDSEAVVGVKAGNGLDGVSRKRFWMGEW